MTCLPGEGRVVGLDLGERRIGVAVSDSAQTIATGTAVVERRPHDQGGDHRALAELVREYGAVGVVVGLPLSLSGEEGPSARKILAELGTLRSAVGLPTETVDERFTTVAAARGLRAGGRRTRQQRAVIDQEAAASLLQTWLDRRRTGTGH